MRKLLCLIFCMTSLSLFSFEGTYSSFKYNNVEYRTRLSYEQIRKSGDIDGRNMSRFLDAVGAINVAKKQALKLNRKAKFEFNGLSVSYTTVKEKKYYYYRISFREKTTSSSNYLTIYVSLSGETDVVKVSEQKL